MGRRCVQIVRAHAYSAKSKSVAFGRPALMLATPPPPSTNLARLVGSVAPLRLLPGHGFRAPFEALLSAGQAGWSAADRVGASQPFWIIGDSTSLSVQYSG